jgi:hypothetical protein
MGGNAVVYWITFGFWPVMVALLVAVPAIDGLSRNVSHIALDVINHFHRVDRRFPIRERIAARFRRVLQLLLDEERPTHLLVVAHSQGTVIAVDVLQEEQFRGQLKGARQVLLATFGSPLTHLYQHYFPRQYPPLDEGDRWVGLRNNVGAWRNVFRIDDYIGTHVGAPDPGGAWPVNHPVGPGGHTNYWTPEVFDLLADWLPGGRPQKAAGARAPFAPPA